MDNAICAVPIAELCAGRTLLKIVIINASLITLLNNPARSFYLGDGVSDKPLVPKHGLGFRERGERGNWWRSAGRYGVRIRFPSNR